MASTKTKTEPMRASITASLSLRTGDAHLNGVEVRGRELPVYVGMTGPARAGRLRTRGRSRTGKAGLTLKRLADPHLGVPEVISTASVAGIGQPSPVRP